MQVYATRTEQLSIGGLIYRLRVLSDKQQFSDANGHRARLGLSATQWGLFGQLWPSERLLAQAMHRFAVDGKRVLNNGATGDSQPGGQLAGDAGQLSRRAWSAALAIPGQPGGNLQMSFSARPWRQQHGRHGRALRNNLGPG